MKTAGAVRVGQMTGEVIPLSNPLWPCGEPPLSDAAT